MKRYLYVMLSHTDTRMGHLIRFFTGEEYNHVSLCLDETFQYFVSFARYRQDVPLAGGYVSETPARFLSCGNTIPVKIFRIPISAADAQKLEVLFDEANHTSLIYNSLGALLCSVHIRCPIPGAYTCLEFASRILGTNFRTISALENELRQWEIYTGDLFLIMQDLKQTDTPFFQKRGFWKGSGDTVIHFKKLLWRMLRLERPQDPIATFNFDILPKNIPQSSI